MKKISSVFLITALLLSHAMCAVVSWQYCDMIWGIRYAGYSAPAWTALFSAVPFAVGIAVCIAAAVYFGRKESERYGEKT